MIHFDKEKKDRNGWFFDYEQFKKDCEGNEILRDVFKFSFNYLKDPTLRYFIDFAIALDADDIYNEIHYITGRRSEVRKCVKDIRETICFLEKKFPNWNTGYFDLSDKYKCHSIDDFLNLIDDSCLDVGKFNFDGCDFDEFEWLKSIYDKYKNTDPKYISPNNFVELSVFESILDYFTLCKAFLQYENEIIKK